MITLEKDSIVSHLKGELAKEFSDEQFLEDELDAIVYGLINSIRFSALRVFERDNLFYIDKINIFRDFSSEVMKRSEIVERIQNTSGLDRTISNHCLRIVEEFVSDRIKSNPPVLQVEHIGILRMAGEGYALELADGLSVHSPYSYEIEMKTFHA